MRNKIIIVISIILILATVVTIVVTKPFEKTGESYKTDTVEVIPSDSENYSNNKVSNIDVAPDYKEFDVNVDYLEYDKDYELSVHASFVSAISYAVYTYYNGNVPYVFSFDSKVDTINRLTNSITEIMLHSDNINLKLYIDMYNDIITVEEIQ